MYKRQDIKFEMKDKDELIFKRYLQLNPDVAVKFSNDIAQKEDISISVEYNALYNFIRHIVFNIEGKEIRGPYWVRIEDDGPGKFFSVLGALSKMWREGVRIRPRHALIKLLFNARNIISFVQEQQVEDEEQQNVRISGNVVLEK